MKHFPRPTEVAIPLVRSNASTRRWMLVGVGFFLPGLFAVGIDDSLKKTEKAAADWVNLRLETSRLETEWNAQRPLLESLTAGLKERVQTLEAQKEQLLAKTAKDREEQSSMDAASNAMRADARDLEARLESISAKLMELRPQLPPRLSAALELAYRSLAETKTTVNERMQYVMTVLNRCTQFNRTISFGQETIRLSEQEEKMLDVVYWGLGQGYALDRATNRAWLGRPGPTGWIWEPNAEAAPSIAKLIAVYQDKSDPDFVLVPAKLDGALPAIPAE